MGTHPGPHRPSTARRGVKKWFSSRCDTIGKLLTRKAAGGGLRCGGWGGEIGEGEWRMDFWVCTEMRLFDDIGKLWLLLLYCNYRIIL